MGSRSPALIARLRVHLWAWPYDKGMEWYTLPFTEEMIERVRSR